MIALLCFFLTLFASPFKPQCYHDYPSRDPRPLAGAAPLGLGVLIALGGILVMMSFLFE